MVEVVHWNPPRRRGVLTSVLRRSSTGQRLTDNFGDLLGPLIVSRILEREQLHDVPGETRRILAVGSILRLARDGDVVWGTGANGKSLDETFGFNQLDVRAVRGPRTRAFLETKGIEAPGVYGDPALLIPHLWSDDDLGIERRRSGIGVVPNLHDARGRTARRDLILPTKPVLEVIRAVAAREFVVGSSLHGVVVAEAFGVPARFVGSPSEPEFKYRDYLEGTGRYEYEIAPTVAAALEIGPATPPVWDPAPLFGAFPADLWTLDQPNEVVAE
jgi:pyruvyltransferase